MTDSKAAAINPFNERLMIVSDGTCLNTRILTEDGREIRATKIEWSLDASESFARATIHVILPKAKILVPNATVKISGLEFSEESGKFETKTIVNAKVSSTKESEDSLESELIREGGFFSNLRLAWHMRRIEGGFYGDPEKIADAFIRAKMTPADRREELITIIRLHQLKSDIDAFREKLVETVQKKARHGE